MSTLGLPLQQQKSVEAIKDGNEEGEIELKVQYNDINDRGGSSKNFYEDQNFKDIADQAAQARKHDNTNIKIS